VIIWIERGADDNPNFLELTDRFIWTEKDAVGATWVKPLVPDLIRTSGRFTSATRRIHALGRAHAARAKITIDSSPIFAEITRSETCIPSYPLCFFTI
jgi:hypothetical protein